MDDVQKYLHHRRQTQQLFETLETAYSNEIRLVFSRLSLSLSTAGNTVDVLHFLVCGCFGKLEHQLDCCWCCCLAGHIYTKKMQHVYV